MSAPRCVIHTLKSFKIYFGKKAVVAKTCIKFGEFVWFIVHTQHIKINNCK